jgi:hypothetical protein
LTCEKYFFNKLAQPCFIINLSNFSLNGLVPKG